MTCNKKWLTVIGIGEDGLSGISPAARPPIDTAKILVGSDRNSFIGNQESNQQRG